MIPADFKSINNGVRVPEDDYFVLMRLRRQEKFQISLCVQCHEAVHRNKEMVYFYPNMWWHAKQAVIIRPMPARYRSPAVEIEF